MKYKRDSEAVYEKIDNNVVVLNYHEGKLITLNETAGRVWDLLKEEKGVEEIVEVIEEEYSMDNKTIEVDVKETLEMLIKEKLAEAR